MIFGSSSQKAPFARPLGRIAALLALAGLAAGCSTRATGVLEPFPGPVYGTEQVEILVATTRSPDDTQPALMFSGDRGSRMAYADLAISIPPEDNRTVGEVQWPRRLPGDPERDFVTVRSEYMDQDAAIARFKDKIARTPGRHVLVFVHGYNNRFEDAVYRFAQIVHDSDADVVPVLFTWPSRGNLLSYTYDRESTNYSRDALEEFLARLARDKSVSDISILAHSMGNWLTLESLRQMAIRNGHIATKIGDVMLAAPDVDVDVFRTQVAAFGEPRPRFTLFVSQKDQALKFSRRLWGSTDRLGAIDPNDPRYRDELARERIAVVDLTNEKTSDRMNHATFAESPQAVHLIGRQLAAGQDLNTYEPGVGDHIGQFATTTGANIGAAAGLLVTAPVAVFDQRTRETYDDRVNHFGQSVSDSLQIDGDAADVAGTPDKTTGDAEQATISGR
ncbi:alpha/beta hydrolase [Microbaculum marinisediminis]|uniref:Alpha/beta hydrolase n=1 Tax=Microbaculum marinisediminis TaxID=2931392 RepID=A0AAW5R818_9HYPH|nr:alpha/beta hydrolase [Microbaculum sp. A6E488]MCT8974794.1 alpha/beta hydrolase [Microbaculum sp. A6E488]